jgi:hypothetical protein
MNRGRLLTLALAVGAMSFSGAVGAGASQVTKHPTAGTVGIRLIPAPGKAPTNPLAKSYVVARLSPGATISRRIEVDNDSKLPLTVRLYVGGARVIHGHFMFAASDVALNDLSRWSALSRTSVRLAPDSDVFETVTTRIPREATEGNDFAVIWASVSAKPTSGSGITLVSRVGVRMYISIGPGGAPASNFNVGTLVAERGTTGRAMILSQVRNTSANTLDLNGALTLSKGPDGLVAGPFRAQLGVVLAPGAVEPVFVTLTRNFPRGPWRANLRVTSGTISRSSAATITFPSRVLIPAPSGIEALTLTLLLITSLVVLGVILALKYSRRHHRTLTKRPMVVRHRS